MNLAKTLATMLVWAFGSLIIADPDDDIWAEYERAGR